MPASAQSCFAASVACVSGNPSFAAQKHAASSTLSKWPRSPQRAVRLPTSHASSVVSNSGVGATDASSTLHWHSWSSTASQRAVNLPHLRVRLLMSHWISLSVSTAALANTPSLAHLHSPTTRHEPRSHSP